ncbi:MAG: hypothetical protein ABI083_05550 [Lapillicoccus sp.]
MTRLTRLTFLTSGRPTALSVTALISVTAALTLAACGGGATATGSASSATSASTQNGQNRAGAGQLGGRIPGTSGLIADVQGTTMQVQGATQQTAVTFTGATSVTKTVAGTAASLVIGDCVVVRDDAAGKAGSGPSASPTTSSPAVTAVTTVTAVAITITQPVKGTCTAAAGFAGGFGGGQGAGQGGGGQSAGGPAGTPTGGTGGTGGKAGRGFGGGTGVVGIVTAVTGGATNGGTVTVRRDQRTRGTATTSATTPPVDVTVTTTGTTTYTVVQKGTSADIKVGECVTALGKADDTGAVAATALALRPAVDGTCAQGRRQGAGASGTTATTNG